jgi:hypothetical protein
MFHWIVFAIAAAASLLLQPQLASIYRHGPRRAEREGISVKNGKRVDGLCGSSLASREEVVGYE